MKREFNSESNTGTTPSSAIVTENSKYSRDGELYKGYEEVMEEFLDDEEIKVGDSVEIYKAYAVPAKHINMLDIGQLVDSMQSYAYDEFGEWSEGYLDDFGGAMSIDLEETLSEWFDENVKKPNFSFIRGVKKVTVVVED